MTGRPGRLQSAFTAGELAPTLAERHELKYRANGLSHAENVVFAPQGGFSLRDGLRDIGALEADAARILPFTSSAGLAYEIVLRPAEGAAWGEAALLDTFTVTGLTAGMLGEVWPVQRQDTLLLFHEDLQTRRIKHLAADDWQVDDLPYENLPNMDYGGPVGGGSYTNGVAAEWQLEFIGLQDATSLFTLTVNGVTSQTITYSSNMTTLAASVQAALRALSNVGDELTAAAASGTKIDVVFAGAANIALGDGWALSGETINDDDDEPILAYKIVPGVAPGEPVISADRGWPATGAFVNDRLVVGGFKPLKGAYMWSVQGDYFDFDTELEAADGARLVEMEVESGEQVLAILNDRNPVILTSEGEYWLAERTLSALNVPNHVHAGENGVRKGLRVVRSESALVHSDGGVLREFAYADVNGNYASEDISLLASHLVADVTDQASRRATASNDGNTHALVLGDGSARLATILRRQEVTAFARLTSADAAFKSVCANGRNELAFITARPAGRRLERMEAGLLLDEAVDFDLGTPGTALPVDARFNGRTIWVIGDNEVLGPFTVANGAVTLNLAVTSGVYGTWTPPVVTTLGLVRMAGPDQVIKQRRRIHSATLELIDTTSIAVSANAHAAVFDVDLGRFGMVADTAELDAGFSGRITLRGFTGYVDDPTFTITQLRPGRLHVRSVTLEASV